MKFRTSYLQPSVRFPTNGPGIARWKRSRSHPECPTTTRLSAYCVAGPKPQSKKAARSGPSCVSRVFWAPFHRHCVSPLDTFFVCRLSQDFAKKNSKGKVDRVTLSRLRPTWARYGTKNIPRIILGQFLQMLDQSSMHFGGIFKQLKINIRPNS